MFDKKEETKKIKRFSYKEILKPSERLCENLIAKTNEINNYKSMLGEYLENEEFGYQIIEDPVENARNNSIKNWKLYQETNDISCLSSKDIYNISFVYSCINNNDFWRILTNFISEKLILALVRNLHYYWTDLDDLDDKINIFKVLLSNLNSNKKIFQIWKKNPDLVIGKNLVKKLLNEIQFNVQNLTNLYSKKQYDIKKNDLISNLINYEYIQFLFEQNESLENIKNIYNYSIAFLKFSQRPNFRIYEADRPNSKSIIDLQKNIVAKLIKTFNKYTLFRDATIDYKNKIFNFLINQYGDPRYDLNYWWKYFTDSDALDILKSWINGKDLKYFFELLVDDAQDGQDRKGFWMEYAKYIDESIFLIGVNSTSYRNNKVQINSIFKDKAVKNKFIKTKHGNYVCINNDSNVFIMKIQDLIIIEFSKTGGACYIYDYQTYQSEEINSYFASDSEINRFKISNLKNKDIAIARVVHSTSLNKSKDWQIKVSHILSKYIQ